MRMETPGTLTRTMSGNFLRPQRRLKSLLRTKPRLKRSKRSKPRRSRKFKPMRF